MARCKVRKGFFILRDCENSAKTSCSVCSRPMCEEHTKELNGQPICADCLAKERNNDTVDMTEIESYQSIYIRNDYSPFYAGRYRDDFYDDYDELGFEQENSDIEYSDDADEDFDFMDS